MRTVAMFCLLGLTTILSGCIVKTAADVVTAPVRVVGGAVDMATTSQSERDEKRGREIRQREEELAKLERHYNKQLAACHNGSSGACDEARVTYAEMERIAATLPAAPHEQN